MKKKYFFIPETKQECLKLKKNNCMKCHLKIDGLSCTKILRLKENEKRTTH